MAIRTSFTAGEVLTAADLTDTFGAKANLASPTFTGTPAGPTAASGTNTTQLATTAFVQGAGGLQLITTQTFSAVSSVSINGCFTSTYENYKVTIAISAASANSVFRARLRASGTDATSSIYEFAVASTNGGNATVAGWSNSTATGFDVISLLTSYVPDAVNLEMFRPQIASSFTTMTVLGAGGLSGVSGTAGFFGAGKYQSNTSFDGLTIYPSSGTISGTIRVYGLKNS